MNILLVLFRRDVQISSISAFLIRVVVSDELGGLQVTLDIHMEH